MNIATMLQHPSSIDHYIRNNWKLVPIPFGSKGPMHKNWNKIESCLQIASDLPDNHGIGLAHAYSGTMALDIDEWDVAVIELEKQGISLDELYEDQDAVIIDSGRTGHGKLLYQMPFGLTLPSKKLIAEKDGKKFNYLDFRCATSNGLTVQDVLPPSVHPDTGKPYKWAGRGSWSNLPVIPDSLLTFWQSLIEEDNTPDIHDGELTTSWSEIQSVLFHISPDLDRDEWVKVGMALHHAGYQDKTLDTAFALWDEWSSQSEEKYKGPKDLMRSWRSFNPGNGITISTLFYIANEHGYTRPQPSAEHLFSAINENPDDLLAPLDLINGSKMKAPELDLSMWPDVLATRAQEIADQVGCDPIVPLYAGIGALCGVVDARTRLELLPGFKVAPVLWMMTSRKPMPSPIYSVVPRPGILNVGITLAHLISKYPSNTISGSLGTATTRDTGGFSSMKSDPSVGNVPKSCERCHSSNGVPVASDRSIPVIWLYP